MTEAEQLADLLVHPCPARARTAGDDSDPHWKCETCGARIEIGFPLHMGQWQYEMMMREKNRV